ncbi:hypothetical protein EJ110_NYTH18905 [Nymphaea thermarum]|nr:hypothetical protein EJ110_NYTH18905 [Nymphaea thermarum]
MPLLESFRQKEVSNLNHGLSSTLSPLAPPFTVKRNAVNQRPNSSQLVEPTFLDYSSPLSGALDNCLHLHPPTSVPDCWRPIDVAAGLGVSSYPTSTIGGVPSSFSYSSGTYEYTSVPVNMELGKERVIADEPYSTPLVLGVQDTAGSGFGSSTGSSMSEYLPSVPWHPDYNIYFSGAVPDVSSQSSGYSATVSKYKPSIQREKFQCGELVKEKQMSDVGQSSEQPSLPKIKTCRSNSTCPQEQELSQHPSECEGHGLLLRSTSSWRLDPGGGCFTQKRFGILRDFHQVTKLELFEVESDVLPCFNHQVLKSVLKEGPKQRNKLVGSSSPMAINLNKKRLLQCKEVSNLKKRNGGKGASKIAHNADHEEPATVQGMLDLDLHGPVLDDEVWWPVMGANANSTPGPDGVGSVILELQGKLRFSASEGLPAINQGKSINSSGRPTQSGDKVTDLKCLSANHQAENSKNNTRLAFTEVFGSPDISLYDHDPPSSDLLPATSAWVFMKSDTVSTNECSIEHGSCTTDSTAVYPFTQVLQPMPSGNHLLNDTVMSENVNGLYLPMDELVNSKDLAGYIFSTGKGSERNSILEGNLVHHSKGDHDASTSYKTICSQGMEDSFSSYQGALDCLSDKRPFGNLDFTASTLNLFSSSEQSLDISAAGCQNFHEKNDQFISAVDSPCWKGIPSFRCAPSEAAENVSFQCFKNFESSDQPLLIHGGTVSLSEASSQLIWGNDECIGGSSPPAVHMTAASLSTQTESADTDEVNLLANKSYFGDVYEGIQRIGEGFSTSNSYREGHELKIPIGVSLTNEQSNMISVGESVISEATVKDCSTCNKGPIQDGLSDLLSQPVGHIQSSFCAGTSFSTDVHEKFNGLSLNPNECLPERTDIHIVLKAMYNLSALLLSRCYADQNALKEHDLEVIQLVTNNLDECIIKKSNHLSEPCPPLESACLEKLRADPCKFTCMGGSQGIPAEIDDIRHTGNKKTSESGRSIHTSGIPKNIGSRKFVSSHDENGVHKAMEKLLKDNLDNESDDLPQVQVYKTLWLEAEAALCAMKYEVRLANMNAEILKGKQDRDATGSLNTRSNSSSGLLSSLNGNFDALDGDNQNLHVAKSSASKHNFLNASSGVMSSLNGVCDTMDGNNQSLHEVKSSASEHNDLESSVIARFRILKCRIEGSNKQEEQQLTLPDSIDIESTQNVDNPLMPSEIRTEIGNHKQPPAKVAASLVPAISTRNTQMSRSSNGDFGAVGVITRSQHEPKGLLSKHNDVEASIAARIKILKQRHEKCGSSDREPAMLPDSIDVEGIDCNQQLEVAVSGHSSQSKAPQTSKNFNMDIGFTAQRWQPFAVASLQDTLVLHDQLAGRHTESPGTCASTTGNTHHMHPMPWQEVETNRSLHAQTSNDLVSLKHPTSSGGVHNRRNERSSGGATSSSQSDSAYDWEHVLKEEISC